MIGKTISHYQVVEKLGEGGMGVVYRALDTRLNRPVAIKVLLADAVADAARRQRFVQEAQAASALNHPSIITVYDVGHERLRPASAGGERGAVAPPSASEQGPASSEESIDFIAMEYVAGRTLDQMIGRKGLPLREALKYAVQIADALATAHAAGIVHRDLKPGNVMVTERGLIKVLDFGLAKLTERVDADMAVSHAVTVGSPRTEEGTILGTVAYMSPEQAEGKKVDARSDIFAFGSLLYEMLTGRRAFQGETKVATLSAILHVEPTPASEIVGGGPLELDRIIAHCLRKDPSRRFQHLDDVRTLLEQLKEESGSAPRVTERREAAAIRTLRVRAVVGGLLVAVAVAGAIWWLGRDRPRGPAPGSAVQPATASGAAAAPATATRPRLSSGGPASSNAEANRYFENAMQSKVVNDIPRARTMLERALELDPRFAEARAWHGLTSWILVDGGLSNDSALLYSAEDEMRRALQDEPTLARAHAGFAMIYLTQGRTELALAEADQAIKTNPGDEDASSALMTYYYLNEEYAAAVREGRQVLERIPLFFPARMMIGEVLRQQGDPSGAIREQERVLDQDSQNIYALTYMARAYMDSTELVKARQSLESVRPADRPNYRSRRTWAILLALEGRKPEALKEMDDEVLKWEALVAYETSEMADFYAVLGDAPKALDWLDRAVRAGDERAEWFRRDPLLASIREHPRFGQILQSIAYRRQRKPVQ